jgi:dimethylaniline monooxygenase (N-oxide forming)
MDLTGVKTAGIVGAGVSGLVTAKTLMAEGLECTVFERSGALGGVWADGYVNFGVQVQKELYEYPDWPLPQGTPDFTPGPVFQKYLEGYAEHFGLTPHIRLHSSVTDIRPREDGKPGWSLAVREKEGESRADFDLLVVCVGLYSNEPYRPEFPGQEDFGGEIVHISQVKSSAPLEDKRVAVLGFGKSATDAALESAAVAKETHLIVREPHWPVPRKLAGILPFKWGMVNRTTSTLIPPYIHPSPLERAVHGFGGPLVWLWWRLVEILLRFQHGLGRKIEGGDDLVPAKPIDIDAFGESTMLPRPGLYRAIGNGRIRAHRSTIEAFDPEGPRLANGRRLEIDLLVLGTGWRSGFAFLPADFRQALGFEEDGLYLYRHMLQPKVPNLVFIGRASTICSVLTYSLQARWLAELIAGRHRLPEAEIMLKEIADMKAWKRAWMPFSLSRSARLIVHMQHYHDELLRDFGANPLRKRGPWAPLKEVIEPYEPADYRDIVAGDWARR